MRTGSGSMRWSRTSTRSSASAPALGGASRGGADASRSWRRGPRLVAVVAIVAVASLAAGVALSRLVVSPAELAANAQAPTGGPITAPIEERVIQNTVTTRADVEYADAVDVKVDSTGLPGAAVVTGHVPEVGATLTGGSVALEVAGRPVIVLPGDLPVYRTLHAGLSGPDVLQLKAALAALSIDPGDTTSDVFDAATAAALDTLYRTAGYPSPAASPDAEQQVTAARQGVRSAQLAVDQAVAALDAASTGASGSQRVEADNGVRDAQRTLDAASQAGDPAEIATAQDALALAEARLADLLEAPSASSEHAAVDSARSQLADAEEALAKAEDDALTVLPASEVVYLSSLPRRVDSVAAERGVVTQGAAMSVSGAELVLSGTASEADAALLGEGMPAGFSTAAGSEYTATVASVAVKKPAAGEAADTEASGQKHYEIRLKPQQLDATTVEALKGSNVKVSIPVQSTSGAVLAVPVAAVTAGPGGESRIEILDDTAGETDADRGVVREPQSGATARLTVTTGLSAGGFVEVRSDDPRLRAGAAVVVGR